MDPAHWIHRPGLEIRYGLLRPKCVIIRGLLRLGRIIISEISHRRREQRHPMSKQHFYFKLIPPRPTFGADMTAEERALMQQHVAYTREAFDAGKILIYGPVLASAGAFGIAILEMDDAAEVQRFGDEDPSIKAGMNTFEFCTMRVGAARGMA